MRDQGWSLADWLHWLEPSQREWFWWDAFLQSRNTLLERVQVNGWPTPLGALEWLLRVCGATDVAAT